jgi:hypothetical protein
VGKIHYKPAKIRQKKSPPQSPNLKGDFLAQRRFMPSFKVYSNGFTVGVPPQKNDHKRSTRGEVQGWSESSTRRNTAFLYSVDTDNLTGYGYALTLTVKELPPSAEDWSRMVNKMLKRLKVRGRIRYHWVTEWQRRGVPHLHAMVYFDYQLTGEQIHELKTSWIQSAAYPGHKPPMIQSQTIKPVTGARGWVQYLGKHGSRGLKHYQRANKPASWKKTGRMWGKGGDWPQRQSEGELTLEHFHRLRRIVRRWRIANARQTPAQKLCFEDGQTFNHAHLLALTHHHRTFSRRKRIISARNMLKCNDRKLSTVRGVSEWIEESLMLQLIHATV